MNRASVAGGIAAIVITTTGVGWLAATKVKSPAQLAARTAPPEASLITYPVEKRVLSADLIVRGTIRYSDPISVVLAPSLLRPPPVLVSIAPAKGTTLNEGDVALVVSGRPVFAVMGSAPGYRDLGPGTVGEDVRQLEQALVRAGFNPGTVDGVFDAATGPAVAKWYARAGYAPFGPNDLQRANLRLAHTAVSQATDRLLQARQAELVNRSGAKPADIVDAKAAVAAAESAVQTAQSTADRDATRAQADLMLKEAEISNKNADIASKEGAVRSATLALEDARRRADLAARGVNAVTGVSLTPEQLTSLQEVLAEANGSVAGAQSDLAASEAVAAGVLVAGAAAISDARAKVAAASAFALDGLTAQQVLDLFSASRTAQSALVATEATAAKDNSVATADVTAKRNALNAANVKVAQAQRRIETAKSGVDPATGLPVATPGDLATGQLALKQAELVLQQSQIPLAPARTALAAAQGDRDATRHAAELMAAVNVQAGRDASARVASARARLAALNLPGVGTKTLTRAVNVAQTEVTRLTDELNKTAATIGVQVPANELVFFPTLPLRIDDTKIKRGDPATADVMTVSGTRLAVDSSLLTTEAPLTKLDAVATIEAPEFGYSSVGHITFVADKVGLRGTDAQHIAIEVTPDSAPTQLVGASVRITIPTKTTNGEALIVPVSALSVRADGSTQLQIEDKPGFTRTVVVTAGLSAQGFVEILPLSAKVSKGDRVVIGTKGNASAVAPAPGGTLAPVDPGSPGTTATAANTTAANTPAVGNAR